MTSLWLSIFVDTAPKRLVSEVKSQNPMLPPTHRWKGEIMQRYFKILLTRNLIVDISQEMLTSPGHLQLDLSSFRATVESRSNISVFIKPTMTAELNMT